jgi:hypothetical protein
VEGGRDLGMAFWGLSGRFHIVLCVGKLLVKIALILALSEVIVTEVAKVPEVYLAEASSWL